MTKIIFYHTIDPVMCKLVNVNHSDTNRAVVLELTIEGIENCNKFLNQLYEDRENSIIQGTFFVTENNYNKIALNCMTMNIHRQFSYDHNGMITIKCVGDVIRNVCLL